MANPIVEDRQADFLDNYKDINPLDQVIAGQSRIAQAVRISDGKIVIIKRYHIEKIKSWDDLEKTRNGAEQEIEFLYQAQRDGRTDVPQILEHGFSGRFNDPVLVMEKITGETLEERISKNSFNPNIQEAVAIAKSVAETLSYAHEGCGAEALIHRDVKPANIMLTPEGKVILIDWSTVKIGGGNTLQNTQLYSVNYSAPEVVEGRTVSPATDVYGLAKVLQRYFLKDVFDTKNGNVTEKDFHGKNIPSHIVSTILKAARENSAERYSSAQGFIDDLIAEDKNKLVAVDDDPIQQLVRDIPPSRDISKSQGLDRILKVYATNSGYLVGAFSAAIGGLSLYTLWDKIPQGLGIPFVIGSVAIASVINIATRFMCRIAGQTGNKEFRKISPSLVNRLLEDSAFMGSTEFNTLSTTARDAVLLDYLDAKLKGISPQEFKKIKEKISDRSRSLVAELVKDHLYKISNFDLEKYNGITHEYPVLFKRLVGYYITQAHRDRYMRVLHNGVTAPFNTENLQKAELLLSKIPFASSDKVELYNQIGEAYFDNGAGLLAEAERCWNVAGNKKMLQGPLLEEYQNRGNHKKASELYLKTRS